MKTVRIRYNSCPLSIHYLSVANFYSEMILVKKLLVCVFRNKVD